MEPRPIAPIAAGLGLIGVTAAAATIWATRGGVYANPDSVSYLRMADGLPLLEHPPGHFPPIYPAALRTLEAIGFGPLGGARALGAGLALVNPVLGGLVVRRRAGDAWAGAVALVLATTTTLATLNCWVSSEALFVTVLLLWFLAIGSDHRHAPVAAGLLVALAGGTRWVGLCLLPAGAVVLWPERRRLTRYLLAALLPVLAWYLASARTGGLADRPLAWHPPSVEKLGVGLASAVAWVDGEPGARWVGALVAVGALVLLVRAWSPGGDRAPGAAAGCYVATLAVTITVVYDQTPIDQRLLSPLLVVVALALPGLARLPVRPALLAGLALVVVLSIGATRRAMDPLGRSMLDLRGGGAIEAAGQLDGSIVSNAPGALWLLADVEAAWLPKVTDPYTARARPEAAAELAALARSLEPGSHVVWIGFYDYRSYLPTEDEVVAALDLVAVARFPDGTIYEIATVGARVPRSSGTVAERQRRRASSHSR